jgi:hypothetical protein
MAIRISGLTRETFQNQLQSAIAQVTGNPLKAPSKINRAMVTTLFGADSSNGNEHTLDSAFSDGPLMPASQDLQRDIQLMVALHPEIAKEHNDCREALTKAGLTGEAAVKPLLALALWLLKEHECVAVDELDLATLYPNDYREIERLIPDTSADNASLHDDRWAAILRQAGKSGDQALQATSLAALYTELLIDDEGSPPVLKLKNITVYDGLSCIQPELLTECCERTLSSIDAALAEVDAHRSEADAHNL